MPQETYSLKQHIEAILFWKGDPLSMSHLLRITRASKENIEKALEELDADLKNRGIVLIQHEGEYTLGTNPESSKLIEAVRTEELSKDLGRAGLETLAIVLYQGPIRRSEIDYIRGVNSNFILRNLLIRGLIERKTDPNDSRAAVYSPSMDILRFLGITKVSELKDFDVVKETIQQFKASGENDEEGQVITTPNNSTNHEATNSQPSTEAEFEEELAEEEPEAENGTI